MLEYKQLYMSIGNRKIADIIEPKILTDTSLEYPNKTMLFWLSPSDIPTGPTSEYGYLANLKLPVVITLDKYTDGTLGNFKENVSNRPSSIIANLRKDAKDFKYLNQGVNKMELSSNRVLIFNIGIINSLYRYSPHPLNLYYKWYNHFKSSINMVTNAVTGFGRNKFVFIKVPVNLPTRLEFERHAKNVSRLTLDTFNTYQHFNMLDIWKLLDPALRGESILNNIPEEEMNNITLVFTMDNKVSLLNLGLLVSIVKEYTIKSVLEKYPARTVRKLFYIFISKLISNSATVDKDTGTKHNDLLKGSISNITDYTKDVDLVNEVDVNNILKNELVESLDRDISNVNDDDVHHEEVEALITSSDIKSVIELDMVTYNHIKELLDEDIKQHKTVMKNIEKLKEVKLITKNKYDKLVETIDSQDNTMISLPGKKPVMLKELLNITSKDLMLDKKETKLPDSKTVFDKTYEYDTIGLFDKKYLENVYDKDLTSTIYAFQNNGIIVDDYEVTRTDGLLGSYDTHKLKLTPLSGGTSSISFRLPVIDNSGEFMISSNKYRVRKQKATLPITKIDNTKVALSSYYGKLFITKATYKKDDIGFWFRKQLIAKYDSNPNLKDLVLMEQSNMDAILPLDYGNISRYVKSFKLNGIVYNFEYSSRSKLLNDKTNERLTKLEMAGYVLIGVDASKNPIMMDMDNRVWKFTPDKNVELDSIYDQLEIDMSNAPIEHADIKIYKMMLPVALLLSYYIGLTQLMKLLNTKYKIVEGNKRTELQPNEYVIKFKDIKLVVEKDFAISDMVISGLNGIDNVTKEVEFEYFNKQDNYNLIFHKLGLSVLYVNEIKLLKDMFVDPITKSLLKELNEPLNFKGLLVRSCELLIDDNYINPNNIANAVIKGYERIPGMVYSEMIRAIKEHNNKSVFSKSNISIKPYSIWAKINEDSTTVLVDDLNPIAEMKQSEDLSLLGSHGRSKVGINRAAREIHPSEIGIVSEATKDSGDVGISMYLSANPKIESLRGIVGKFNLEEDGISTTLSTTSLLMPGSNKDDVKRLTN